MYQLFIGLLLIISSSALRAVTTVAPNQSTFDFLDPEAQAVGFDRAWLLAVQDDPIIQQAEKETIIASPQEGRTIWLNAANKQAERGKPQEIIYCLYRRQPFIQHWNTAPFRWALFIELGQALNQSKQIALNPFSIAIAKGDIDQLEIIMPKASPFVQELAAASKDALCRVLITLLIEAIKTRHIPITSKLIDRIKTYNLWDYQTVQILKPSIAQAAFGNKEMIQLLRNEGLSIPVIKQGE